MRRSVGAGLFSVGLAMALAFLGVLSLSRTDELIGFCAGAVLMAAGALIWFTLPRKSAAEIGQRAHVEGGGVAAAGGRDAYTAGRDVIVVHPSKDERAKALRAIKDEISHIEHRFKQLEKLRDEWNTLLLARVEQVAPYQRLPAERWNTYSTALGLSDADHETVREAYERANDFNREMVATPSAFGDYPEPDLDGLKAAFTKARAVIDRAFTCST